MKMVIKEKEYSTYNAICLGYRHIGEYGHVDGYEEQLYLSDDGQYFIYGVGGPDSPYTEPEIILITEEKAKKWRKKST
ncbi:MAG: hypothetical protein FWD90_14295 [Defluviitaleaceae bacterium]|nr:hypothetical protein [Defluviitaleaceae bacterium]